MSQPDRETSEGSGGSGGRRAGARSVVLPVIIAGVIAVVIARAWASWSYRRMQDAALDARFTPRYKDPPAGPRAPRSEAFGARVGGSSLPEVQALLKTDGRSTAPTPARAR